MSDMNEQDLDILFFDTLKKNDGTCWKVAIQLEWKRITFKVDTGAEATAISEDTFKNLSRITLTRSQKSLRGLSGQPLPCIRTVPGETISHGLHGPTNNLRSKNSHV